MKTSMRISKMLIGLIIVCAATVLLGGCERLADGSSPVMTSMSDTKSQSNAPEVAEDEIFNSSEPETEAGGNQPVIDKPIAKSDVREYKSTNPAFSFQYTTDFKVETVNREQEFKTGEISFVGVDYLDSDEPENTEENSDYFANKPSLYVIVYELSASEREALINQEANPKTLTNVSIGNNEFLRGDTSGLVESSTYYLVKNDLLYAITLAGYPPTFTDPNKNAVIEAGFTQVLKSFQAK